MTKERDIKDFLNKESASKIANDLVVHLLKFVSNPKIGKADYSYDLEKGKVSSQNTNTWISFNLENDTEAKRFLKALYSREISDTEDEEIGRFMTSIATSLPVIYEDELKEAVRSACVRDSDPLAIPLDNIKITYIEFVDYSAISDHQLIKINKKPGAEINTPRIMKILTDMREQTGESKADIGNREIQKGNKDFDGIASFDGTEEYLWDVSISLFVDYSLSDNFMNSIKR